MDLKLSSEEQVFQQEIRTWFEDVMPEGHPFRGGSIINMSRDEMAEWQATLNSNGWGAIGWPQELGGTGWNDAQKAIFQSEAARVNAPGQSPFGVTMVGPVLCAFGSDEQKAEHLPHILDGSRFWCQGYSEPGSGSDLASLRTAAIRDGDD
ncbi:MAG TPA: pimeloyl-CoA dehydrogenase large subunit, partial [Rhodobiaceae bacterium]|nr:pimeloyl-CoA dehydrogenase large subunit [Rhodobiaceae bacterium]